MSQFGSITQDVKADADNTSEDNLAVDAVFKGEWVSTLGVVGLQWAVNADQNMTVCVEEAASNADDGDDAYDIQYCFDYISSKGGRGETVQATMAFWRLKVTNVGFATATAVNISGVLCPIAVPMPSGLSEDGRVKVEAHISDELDRHIAINPTNEMPVSPVPRLVGTAFIGTTLDPNFWDGTDVSAGGTVAQTGGIVSVDVTATADSYAKTLSQRSGRFVAGSAMNFAGGFNFKTAATANNLRRAGVYDDNDGFFFQLNGTTFSIGSRIGASDTLVNSGSFNGVYGSTWVPVAGTYYKLSIEYTPLAVFWIVNGKLLHKISGAGQSATMTLPIQFENTNTGAVAIIEFDCVGAYIAREGELITNGTFHYINGAETTVLKYGAGVLQRVVITDTANASLTMYDGLSAVAGTEITLIDSSKTSGSMEFNAPFSTGLYIVATAGIVATIIYE